MRFQVVASLIICAASSSPVLAEDPQLRSALQTETQPVKVQVVPPPPIKEELPYIGVGGSRTKDIILFPFKHPKEFANKITFPARHPMVFLKNAGNDISPYQNGLNALGAVANIATPIIVGAKNFSSTTIVRP